MKGTTRGPSTSPPSPPLAPQTQARVDVRWCGANLRELAEQKEKELRDLHALNLQRMEGLLADRDRQLDELRERFAKLREDALFNLKLLDGRDAELDRYDGALVQLQQAIRDRDTQLSDLKVNVGELESQVRQERMKVEETDRFYQQKLKAWREEVENLRWRRDDELRKQREHFEGIKKDLLRQLKDKEEAMDGQWRDLSAKFDEQLRVREAELEEEKVQLQCELSSAMTQITSLQAEGEDRERKLKMSGDEVQRLQAALVMGESKLKTALWELDDATRSKAARVAELEDELREVRHTRDVMGDLHESQKSEMERKILHLEKALEEATLEHTRRTAIQGKNHEEQLATVQKSFQAQVDALSREAEVTAKEMERLRREGKELSWQIEDLTREKDSHVATTKAESDRIVREKDERVRELEQKSWSLETELNSTREKLETTRRHLEDRRKDIVQLREEHLSSSELITRLRRELETREHTGHSDVSAPAPQPPDPGSFVPLSAEGVPPKTTVLDAGDDGFVDLQENTEGRAAIDLAQQNEVLRSIISEMRKEMESVQQIQQEKRDDDAIKEALHMAQSTIHQQERRITELTRQLEDQDASAQTDSLKKEIDALRNQLAEKAETEHIAHEQNVLISHLKSQIFQMNRDLETRTGSSRVQNDAVAENRTLQRRLQEARDDVKRLTSERDKLIDINNVVRAEAKKLQEEKMGATRRHQELEEKIAAIAQGMNTLTEQNNALRAQLMTTSAAQQSAPSPLHDDGAESTSDTCADLRTGFLSTTPVPVHKAIREKSADGLNAIRDPLLLAGRQALLTRRPGPEETSVLISERTTPSQKNARRRLERQQTKEHSQQGFRARDYRQ